MNRRALVFGACSGMLGVVGWRPVFAVPAPPPPSPERGLYPVIPDVVHAWTDTFANINKATILTEPVTVFFWAFIFADTASAQKNFDFIAKYYHDYVAKDAAYSVNDRSIGRIGDERRAYFDDTKAPLLAAIIRIGSGIQVSMAIALGGNLTGYMANLLPDVVPTTDADPSTFIPHIDDIPPGWEAAWDEPIDITAFAQGHGTPAPSATPKLTL